MQIAIMMSVGCQNLGDELILKNEINLLRQKYGEKTQFKVFTYSLDDIFYIDDFVEYIDYFPNGIKNIKNIYKNINNYFNFIKVIKKSDKIVFGGGGIFFDNETGNFSNPLNIWLFRANIIKIFKKDLIIYGVSIDINNQKNIKKIKNIFQIAKEIYVRDENSFSFLQKINLNSTIIKDPVFYDNLVLGKKSSLIKKVDVKDFGLKDLSNVKIKNKVVGIAFRSLYLKDEIVLIKEIIDYIIISGGKVILIPHSFHKIDLHANDYEFLKGFILKDIEITKNMQESYQVYKQKKIDLCLSMRLHSMILCESYGIEFIGIKYAKKGDLI